MRCSQVTLISFRVAGLSGRVCTSPPRLAGGRGAGWGTHLRKVKLPCVHGQPRVSGKLLSGGTWALSGGQRRRAGSSPLLLCGGQGSPVTPGRLQRCYLQSPPTPPTLPLGAFKKHCTNTWKFCSILDICGEKQLRASRWSECVRVCVCVCNVAVNSF